MRLPTYDEQNEFILKNIGPFLFGDVAGIKDVFRRMYNRVTDGFTDFALAVVAAVDSKPYTAKTMQPSPANIALVVDKDGNPVSEKEDLESGVIGDAKALYLESDRFARLDTPISGDIYFSLHEPIKMYNQMSYVDGPEVERIRKALGIKDENEDPSPKGPGAAA